MSEDAKWAIGILVGLLALLVSAIYFTVTRRIDKIEDRVPISCVAHRDKIGEIIRTVNKHERQISKWKYAVADCIAFIRNRWHETIKVNDNIDPDIINDIPGDESGE